MLASDLMLLGREALSGELLAPIIETLSASGLESCGSVSCMLKYAEVLATIGDADKR